MISTVGHILGDKASREKKKSSRTFRKEMRNQGEEHQPWQPNLYSPPGTSGRRNVTSPAQKLLTADALQKITHSEPFQSTTPGNTHLWVAAVLRVVFQIQGNVQSWEEVTTIPGLRSCTETNGRASVRNGRRSSGMNGWGGDLVGSRSVSDMHTKSQTTLTIRIPVYCKRRDGCARTGKSLVHRYHLVQK